MAVMNYLTQCTFDFGALGALPKVLAGLGVKRPFVVTDPGLKANGLLDKLLAALGDAPAGVFTDTPANPTESASLAAANAYKAAGADGIIAFGGGSSMDLAKAMGLMVTHEGPFERLGGSQRGSRFITAIPPLVAVPTTAGTGSEVSPGAVVILDNGRKETFVSPHLVPKAAVCDPELTLGLPAHVTAATGMDALTHNIESYLSPAYHPLCDGIALEGTRIAAAALLTAVKEPGNLAARSDMMMSSMMGAIAFQKDLGAVHSCAHALGAVCDLHHGLANALMIDTVMAWNQDAVPAKFEELAHVCKVAGGGPAFVPWLKALKTSVGITGGLAAHGVKPEHLPRLVDIATQDICHQTNPRPCTAADFERLFKAAM